MNKSEVERSLINQLEEMNADIACFVDLVKDYMRLWVIKDALAKDIKKRGVVYKDYSSVGVEMMKNNPSTKELLATNRQMLAILSELGINTDKCINGDKDDDADL